ncbi:papain family cysteine protease [Oesophagostomum dentatum]|uniref:Papain family cysteine protease n=1 Tax=Oesophagostomum dentatum TaxID=61180 RepID=A0A0B1TGM8_OESDE|nr:papain family cysteine protease [Oesophagostomum dentatum]
MRIKLSLNLKNVVHSFRCSGGYPLKAWDYWVENGIVTGGDYGTNVSVILLMVVDTCQPYPFPSCHKHANYSVPSQCSHAPFATPKCSHECNENYPQDFKRDKHFGMISYGIEKDELAIRKELMRYGPIEVVFLVYTDFFHYRSGIYKHTAGLLAGGHAVKLIGWGKEHGTPYWLIVNSWGNYWGDKGCSLCSVKFWVLG